MEIVQPLPVSRTLAAQPVLWPYHYPSWHICRFCASLRAFVRIGHYTITSQLMARSVKYVCRFVLRNHNMLAEP